MYPMDIDELMRRLEAHAVVGGHSQIEGVISLTRIMMGVSHTHYMVATDETDDGLILTSTIRKINEYFGINVYSESLEREAEGLGWVKPTLPNSKS